MLFPDMPLGVRFLHWVDVDPALHAFDPALARAIALDIVGNVVGGKLERKRTGGAKKDRIERELKTGLLEAYGSWMIGWNWAASEPGGGGPIRSWCCDDHSIFARGDAGALPTIERVVAAVTEWRTFLESIAALYRELRDATAAFDLPHRTEHAASRLVALVVERTGAEDAWYATFTQLLRWFLEYCGQGPIAEDAIAEVVHGRFESWIAPDPATIAAVVRGLGDAVKHAPSVVDSLAIWLAVRDSAFSLSGLAPVNRPVQRDAHRSFIETQDRARDPVRAERMLSALDACRASALRGEPLTFALLASWQQIVLGTDAPAPWRTTDAFARHVRYAYSPDLPARFEAAIAEANGTDSVAVCAVRAYLDICFFHPFADGNARAARLALDHVLTRAGLGLNAIEPLIVIARSTDDVSGVYTMTEMLRLLAGPTAVRWLREHLH